MVASRPYFEQVWQNSPAIARNIPDLHGRRTESTIAADLSIDGKYVLASTWSVLYLMDSATGAIVQIAQNLTDSDNFDFFTACSFSPNGQYFASGLSSGVIYIIDTNSRQTIHKIPGHDDSVNACVFSPDSKLMFSASHDHTLKLWNVTTGENIYTLSGHTDSVFSCEFSPDGFFLLSASSDTSLCLWKVSTGELIHTFYGHTGSIRGCSFSHDGKYIISAAEDRADSAIGTSWIFAPTLNLWDLDTRKLLHTFSDLENSFLDTCKFSPNDKYIVSASRSKKLCLWDRSTYALLTTFHGIPGKHCSWHPDGEHIMISGQSGVHWIKIIF